MAYYALKQLHILWQIYTPFAVVVVDARRGSLRRHLSIIIFNAFDVREEKSNVTFDWVDKSRLSVWRSLCDSAYMHKVHILYGVQSVLLLFDCSYVCLMYRSDIVYNSKHTKTDKSKKANAKTYTQDTQTI